LLCKTINKPDGFVNTVEIKVTPGRFSIYFEAPLSERIETHDSLLKLSGIRLIFINVGFDNVEIIDRIIIDDARNFLSNFGFEIRSDMINKSQTLLTNLQIPLPIWAREKLTYIAKEWKLGKKPLGCGPENVLKIIDAFRFISWYEVQNDKFKTIPDLRTLSSLLYGSSKRLEKIQGIIIQLYKQYLPSELEFFNPAEIMEYLGISRFPSPFQIRGDIQIETSLGIVEVGSCWPYLAIPPDGIISMISSNEPEYILFIENQTTYQRYVREINDAGWIFYTGGFPSRPWQRLFQMIAALNLSNTQFYHWGDRDVGGYKILRFMQKLINKDLRPYRMGPNEHCNTVDKNNVIAIKDLLAALGKTSVGALELLYEQLSAMDGQTLPWLEQEHMDMISPKQVQM